MKCKAIVLALLTAQVLLSPALSRSMTQQPKTVDPVDVIHYKIDAEIDPTNFKLSARTLVRVRLAAATRSVVLELNGSLVVSRVLEGETNQPLEFLQDRLDQVNVRVDLGKAVDPGTEVSLIFEYSGEVRTAEGGPLPDKRLAYVGAEGSYLFYAARWFPFHNYVSDRASYEINLTMPQGLSLAGYSEYPIAVRPWTPEKPTAKPETPQVEEKEKPTITRGRPQTSRPQRTPPPQRKPTAPEPKPPAGQSKPPAQDRVVSSLQSSVPVLPGSLAVGKYITKEVKTAGGTVEVFAKPGDESAMEQLAEPIGRMLQVYTSKFGRSMFGDRLRVAEIDNDSLDYYSGPGVLFIAPRLLASDQQIDLGRLAREVSYQWWGQGVALKGFDDAWLWHGLGQYSSLVWRENTGSQIEFEQAVQESLESALTFESASSIARAPSELYDLSPGYQSVVYQKGAFVFHMLRYMLGDEKFFNLIKTYYSTYSGKNAGLGEFEDLTTKLAGRNMRGFFGQWVDSTGVPEFRVEYMILRTQDGKFRARGTVKQNFEIFEMPVELLLRSEGDKRVTNTIQMKGTEASFDMTSETLPQEVIVDPNYRILHLTDQIRIAVIVRRGIEHLKGREYPEAEQQFRAALELDSLSSWAHYNLARLFFEQRNYQRALDAFNDSVNGNQRPAWVIVWSHIYRGNCWDALNQRERAVAEYQKAVDTHDDYNGAQQTARQFLSEPFTPTRNRAGG